MSPDGAHAATLHLDLLTPDDGDAWQRLVEALPQHLSSVLEKHGGRQRRRALVAAAPDGRPLALAHLVSRPATAQAKLNVLWTGGNAALSDFLLVEAERLAVQEGNVLLKIEEGPALDPDGTKFSAVGYAELPPSPQERHASGPRGWWKALGDDPAEPKGRPSYYSQTTKFTCGPACLGMAMTLEGVAGPLERAGEIQLWREATTVHAPAGPGGCDPFGLALAAKRRGLEVAVLTTTSEPILLDRAKEEAQRDLMRFVQEGFRREAAAEGIPTETRPVELAELLAAVRDGASVILLIDDGPMHADGAPHWVLLHGFCGDAVLVSDPWIDVTLGESWVDNSGLAVPPSELDAMAWYGAPAYRCALVLRGGRA